MMCRAVVAAWPVPERPARRVKPEWSGRAPSGDRTGPAGRTAALLLHGIDIGPRSVQPPPAEQVPIVSYRQRALASRSANESDARSRVTSNGTPDVATQNLLRPGISPLWVLAQPAVGVPA